MSDNTQERRKDYMLLGQISADIKTIKDDVKTIEGKVDKHSEDLAALKVKAGIWGFVAGALGTIGLYLKLTFAKGGH